MPRDSNGNFSLVPGTIVSIGDTVLPSQHNPAFQDVASALTNSLDRSGTGGMVANLNLNGFSIRELAAGSAGVPSISFTGDIDTGIFSPGPNSFAGAVNGSEVWRTTSTGAFSIGTTSGGLGERLIVQNSQSRTAAFFNSFNASGVIGLVNSLGSNANDTASYHMIYSTGGSDKAVVLGNGNMLNVNNSYGTLSDVKLKRDIEPAGSQWEDVKALAAVMSKFRFKNDPAGPKQLGWIAQDVQPISPQLVSLTSVDGQDVLGLVTSVAFLKAFKALGEAQERIEALEAQVAALA